LENVSGPMQHLHKLVMVTMINYNYSPSFLDILNMKMSRIKTIFKNIAHVALQLSFNNNSLKV
jgi:hypothetical protein